MFNNEVNCPKSEVRDCRRQKFIPLLIQVVSSKPSLFIINEASPKASRIVRELRDTERISEFVGIYIQCSWCFSMRHYTTWNCRLHCEGATSISAPTQQTLTTAHHAMLCKELCIYKCAYLPRNQSICRVCFQVQFASLLLLHLLLLLSWQAIRLFLLLQRRSVIHVYLRVARSKPIS